MFYDAWKLVCHKPFRYICTCIHQAIESSCAHTQVQQDNSAVELPMVELEKAEKGVKVAESVLAVSSDVKTNFGNSSTIVLTTYRLVLIFVSIIICACPYVGI